MNKRILLIVSGFLIAAISSSVHAEVRCHEEKDVCLMRCDSQGKNCYNDCPKRQVCVEVGSSSQSSIKPAGGVRNDRMWGGITIPLDPKMLNPDQDARD
jgi:hypothetical protein